MALSDDQVVNSLLSYYKSRNIDLTFLLGDPTFRKMGTNVKIDFLRQKAQELADGYHKGFTKSERASIGSSILMSALGGAGAAGVAMSALASKIPQASMANKLGVMGIAAAATGILGGVQGYLGATTDRDKRTYIHDELRRTAKDPSDANLVGLLSVGSTPAVGLKQKLLSRIGDEFAKKQEAFGANVGSTMLPIIYGVNP